MQTHTTETKQVGVFPCRGLVAPCHGPRSWPIHAKIRVRQMRAIKHHVRWKHVDPFDSGLEIVSGSKLDFACLRTGAKTASAPARPVSQGHAWYRKAGRPTVPLWEMQGIARKYS